MALGRVRSFVWFVAAISMFCFRSVSSSSQKWYSVIVPNSLSVNKEYVCAISLSDSDYSKPTNVTIKICEQDESSQNEIASQSALIDPGITETFKLQVGDVHGKKMVLKVTGEGGMEFSHEKQIELMSKALSVFIQTDQAKYKPGSKIQFRVLVLDSDMKPNIDSKLHLYITDGNDNRIKAWKDISTKKGVWTGELQLSDNPVFGNWKIHASVLNQKAEKRFEVSEYVLPKFEVSLNVPQHGLITDENIPVHILAKYTFGGGVKGKATIIAKSGNSKVHKTVPIDKEAVVDFNILNEMAISAKEDATINFDATVEEELTGKTQQCSGSIQLHAKQVKLEFIKEKEYFIPGLRYIVNLKVTKYDGTPVTNRTLPIIVKHHFNLYRGRPQIIFSEGEKFEIPESGLIKLVFQPPSGMVTMQIKAHYGDNVDEMITIRGALSEANHFIQALVDRPIKVNSEVNVEIDLTEHTETVYYLVTGKDGILLADRVSISQGKTSTNFSFVTTPLMSPNSKLLVYYFRKDLSFVGDSVDLELKYELSNFVKVESSVSKSVPGQGIQLNIEAKPKSYVGLLGVDQSSILLKTGNDISMGDIINEINLYKFKKDSHVRPRWSMRVFVNAGMTIFTNGKLEEPYFRNIPLYRERYALPQVVYSRSSSNTMDLARSGSSAIGLPGYQGELRNLDLEIPRRRTGSSKPIKPKLRSLFPETWIWKDYETNEDGKILVNETLPDTITSWVISAFSLNSDNGLAIIDQPTKIKVFRPFFVSLDLPYSIIRGETVTIPVIVFNYMDTEVTADVILLNNAGQFKFGDAANSIADESDKEIFKKESVSVKPNTGEKTSFTITATELGYISIKVSAKSDIAADLVERKLLVKAEGETQFKNEALLVDLRTEDNFEQDVFIDLPDKFVDGSLQVEISAVGDILGTSLENLENLVRMPYGCGEQNMLNFVPNILVLDYLKNTRQLSPTLEKKCLKFMDTGYQRELTYMHRDGSFSAFGKSDNHGSTWLTAFVLKSFISAQAHMDIDKSIIQNGLHWLASNQAHDGTFNEVGSVWDRNMQGGSGIGLALTSFTLMPFLAYNEKEHKSVIMKSLTYIEKQLQEIKNDTYSLAISAYALHLADHPAKDTAFHMLQANAQTSGSKMFWKRAAKESDLKNPNANNPNSQDVEMTSYAMLTYLERNLVGDTMKITNWLMSQQNSKGGFASTQDTVVALTALSKLAAKLGKESDLTVTFSTDKGFSNDISINPNNAMVLQKNQVKGMTSKVNIKAKGRGLAIVQVSYKYNIDVKETWPMFNIKPTVTNKSETNQLLLDICSSFISGAEGDGAMSSNMAVMEVSLPSGYTVDQDSLQSLKDTDGVKKVELSEADTHIALYFDEMTQKEICPQILASRSHKVKKSKPVPITVYDYYDQSRRARVFYSIPEATQLPV